MSATVIPQSLSLFPLAAPPSAPRENEIYNDATDGLLRWNGTSWVALSSGGSSTEFSAIAKATSDQALSGGVDTVIDAQVSVFDPSGMITSLSPLQITAPQSGMYRLSAILSLSETTATNGAPYLYFKVNGSFTSIGSSGTTTVVVGQQLVSVSFPMVLATNDIVEVSAWVPSAGSVSNFSASPGLVSVEYVGST